MCSVSKTSYGLQAGTSSSYGYRQIQSQERGLSVFASGLLKSMGLLLTRLLVSSQKLVLFKTDGSTSQEIPLSGYVQEKRAAFSPTTFL